MKDSIIKVARAVFSKYGFKKTTMEDIAKAAGKGKSSLYYYFKSKEEVFEIVLDCEVNILRDELMKAINTTELPQQKLRTYVLKRMEMFHNLVNFFDSFKQEYFENYGFIERIRKSYDEEEKAIISKIIQEGIDKKIFMVNNVELTSMAIIMAMKGFEYPWATVNDNEKIVTDIDNLLEILFNGLLKR
jgi:AcrR family transcriptional regulator